MRGITLLMYLSALLVPGLAAAQGPAGDPRDNLDHPGAPTDRYLDAGEIRDLLHGVNDQFYACYREHVRGTKEAGEVVVSFSVTQDGAVADAVAELDGAPAELGPCLVKVLSGLEFAEHDGDPVVVSYPLVYQVDRRGARVLPYPVVFTKPRPVRLPLLLLPTNIGPGELRMLERILIDSEKRSDADKEARDELATGEDAAGGQAPLDEQASPAEPAPER